MYVTELLGLQQEAQAELSVKGSLVLATAFLFSVCIWKEVLPDCPAFLGSLPFSEDLWSA